MRKEEILPGHNNNDAFSTWVQVFPTGNPDALMVAKALTKIIIPEKVYCDNATHFVNKVISHLVTVFRSTIKCHCSYHPQSAGLIKTKLRKALTETGRNWVQCLPLIMYSEHAHTSKLDRTISL